MMKFDEKHGLLKEEIDSYQERVSELHRVIHEKTGQGNDYLGWVDWPVNYDKEEFERIKEVASKVKDKAEVLLVCGIGGSYLGARAAIEMIQGLYPDNKTEYILIIKLKLSLLVIHSLVHIQLKY